ncbi:LuxR family two component transcriptional regulator [Micromonospora pisi]|uniref:LuxR family two component transcriptional regulator n=1 Tax=Micromonospora pisi TaxID=589240 RepID=A0A495JPY7_9ACTN|nr:response regulator transcription factor [Micromonospora pisi]RKR91026.1 LuxR family two component transcriptional regulator [Micromonospora pisi]
MIRLVIVDDQALVREGLSLILDAQPDFEVVAELPDGDALLELLAEDPVVADVILLDLYLPGADGVRVLGQLRSRLPEVSAKVLMLTTVGRAADIQRALTAGADGFVLKDASGGELAAAVRGAYAGVTALSASAADLLWPSTPAPAAADAGARLRTLTQREREVLALLGQGMSNQDIARDLALAERTVKAHVSNLLGKLAVTSRTQAALIARDLS